MEKVALLKNMARLENLWVSSCSDSSPMVRNNAVLRVSQLRTPYDFLVTRSVYLFMPSTIRKKTVFSLEPVRDQQLMSGIVLTDTYQE